MTTGSVMELMIVGTAAMKPTAMVRNSYKQGAKVNNHELPIQTLRSCPGSDYRDSSY